MKNKELELWADTLKKGDTVAVKHTLSRETPNGWGVVYRNQETFILVHTVQRVLKTQIELDTGAKYKRTGYSIGTPVSPNSPTKLIPFTGQRCQKAERSAYIKRVNSIIGRLRAANLPSALSHLEDLGQIEKGLDMYDDLLLYINKCATKQPTNRLSKP